MVEPALQILKRPGVKPGPSFFEFNLKRIPHQRYREEALLVVVNNTAGAHIVILVEDILDTGLTMTFLKKMLMAHQPRVLKTATLLDKPSRRVLPIEADYVGFLIPDRFVIGYGLDYAERYRNLPDICVLAEPPK